MTQLEPVRLQPGKHAHVKAPPAPEQLTQGQRERFLEAIKNDRTLGNWRALRLIGVPGTKRDLHALIDREDGLEEAARLARGWDILRVEKTMWDVAVDTEHKYWFNAARLILGTYEARFAEHRVSVDVEHAGTITVTHERGLTLADVQEHAGRLTGLGGSTRGELPRAGAIRAEPAEDQPATGDLPPRP